MYNGKLQIINAVLKFREKPFKAAAIHHNTGLSRNLVTYHLTKLTEGNYLTKDGMFYTIKSYDDLLDLLTNVSNNNILGLLEEKYPLLADQDKLNRHVKFMVAMRIRKAPKYQAFVDETNNQIDRTIEGLKGIKRYLNAKQFSDRLAVGMGEEIWKELGENFMNVGVTEEQFNKAFPIEEE